MKSMEFSDWIEKKYIEWRVFFRATVREYAEYLGVSQPLLSQWMKRGGKIPRAARQVNALIARYPDDPMLYELLGIERPRSPLSDLPAEVVRLTGEIRSALKNAGVSDPESPEGIRIASDIMEAWLSSRKDKV